MLSIFVISLLVSIKGSLYLSFDYWHALMISLSLLSFLSFKFILQEQFLYIVFLFRETEEINIHIKSSEAPLADLRQPLYFSDSGEPCEILTKVWCS